MTPVQEDTPPNHGGGILNIMVIVATLLLVYQAIRYIDRSTVADDFQPLLEEMAE